MEQKKKSCHDSEELLHQKEEKKTAGNNQWTNNNLKYYPDERDRQDGPGGNWEKKKTDSSIGGIGFFYAHSKENPTLSL